MSAPVFLTYTADPICVWGDNLKVDGVETPILQYLVFKQLQYLDDISVIKGGENTGNVLQIDIEVLFYKSKNEDGTPGERLGASTIMQEYTHHLIANRTTWVDATTGSYIGVAGDELVEENIIEGGKFWGKHLIREIEFFDQIADAQYQPGVRGLVTMYLASNKARVQPK